MLEASVDALLTTEDTLPKLSSENEHLQNQIANLAEQLDTRDRELDQERSARRTLEELRDAKIQEVESSWKAVVEEKKDNWEAREKSLTDKIESQERLLTELKASYEVSQRLKDGGSDEVPHNSASAAELEIVSSDLDRTSQRLAEVEARNEQLRVELAQASSNTRQAAPEEDPNNVRLRSENSALLRKLENARLEKDTETRKIETRIRALEKEALKLEHDRENLRTKVQSWRDYDEIKQELEIFKVRMKGVLLHFPKLTSRSRLNSPPLTTTKSKATRMLVQKAMPMVSSKGIRKIRLSNCYLQEIKNSAMRWLY